MFFQAVENTEQTKRRKSCLKECVTSLSAQGCVYVSWRAGRQALRCPGHWRDPVDSHWEGLVRKQPLCVSRVSNSSDSSQDGEDPIATPCSARTPAPTGISLAGAQPSSNAVRMGYSNGELLATAGLSYHHSRWWVFKSNCIFMRKFKITVGWSDWAEKTKESFLI